MNFLGKAGIVLNFYTYLARMLKVKKYFFLLRLKVLNEMYVNGETEVFIIVLDFAPIARSEIKKEFLTIERIESEI